LIDNAFAFQTIILSDSAGGGGGGAAPVPEPGTVGLMLVGAMGLLGLSRLNKKR
jgi:hypothetical protein